MPSEDYIKIEEEIFEFWNKNQIYKKAKEKNQGKKKFYFLDGPPYTSGKVHIGTAWNKSLKDSFLRYKRMSGIDVWDRAGYDMHGLPTENATQKKLNLNTKKEIEEYGIDKFIEECKKLCIENLELMNQDFKRLGVWMDFDNAYQSIKKEFMNGEWWLIKKAHEKGRLYEGLRTMTWCPITESALAKHELEYKTVKDNSIFLKFKLKGKENEYLVIWTTTPWTIPFNLAVMVNPDVDYLRVQVDNEVWIIAAALCNVFMSGLLEKQYKVLEEIKGYRLEGLEYIPPLYNDLKALYDPIKAKSPKTHTVLLSSEYVDASGGSGLVHCAPGCGPEDYEIGHKNGLPAFNLIDTKGVFPKEMGRFFELIAKNDDYKFVEYLKEVGALITTNEVEHEYPHDWRHHNPVIFRTTKQWFFKVEDLKQKMVDYNNEINWNPKSAYHAFDSWLRNLRDNSISKQRYWGTPIPVWKNINDDNDYIVVGSSEELEELSGQKVDDLHISTVDKIEIHKDGKVYVRIKDILDVWVDAGTVSWNCLDYPKNKELFNELFPAEFILEGKDQIRGWFNLLHVASVIAFDKPSYKNVYMHGFVQDSQGRKMSKSLGNYILPGEIIEKFGADTLRYYMISGTNPGLDINYNFEDMKVKHRNIGILWNLQNYLIDLCKTSKINPLKIKNPQISVEENYILSRLNSTIKNATQLFNEFKLNDVPNVVEELFLDLSRTYIQLIRDKATIGEKKEKEAVIYTIYEVIMGTLKLFAPICPFITERIYQNIKNTVKLECESIHLLDWPISDDEKINKKLEEDMVIVQNIIGAILNAREKVQLGVRWPLSQVFIDTKDENAANVVRDYSALIKNQTNIKEISMDKIDMKVEVKPNYKTLGVQFNKTAPQIIAHLTTQSPTMILSHIEKSGKYSIVLDNLKIDLTLDHIIIEKEIPPNYVESEFTKGSIYLNKEITPEQEAEGYARELMRRVQALRKREGFNKNDSINLYVACDKYLGEGFLMHKAAILEKVGAKEINISNKLPENVTLANQEKVRGKDFSIGIEKK